MPSQPFELEGANIFLKRSAKTQIVTKTKWFAGFCFQTRNEIDKKKNHFWGSDNLTVKKTFSTGLFFHFFLIGQSLVFLNKFSPQWFPLHQYAMHGREAIIDGFCPLAWKSQIFSR